MEHAYGAGSLDPWFDARLARLAAGQHGCFSRTQAIGLGATRGLIQRRVATGRWEQLSPHAFRMSGAPPNWRQILIGTCFTWGRDVAISHRAAAGLIQFRGCATRLVEITVPETRRRTGGGVIVHRARLEPVDVMLVDAIPVTTVARTLIDLAAVCPRDQVEQALDDALRRHLVSLSRIAWRVSSVAGRGGRPGVRLMRELIGARIATIIPRSELESAFLRLVERRRLPPPTRQHEIRLRGRLLARVDFAYPDPLIAIELDSHQWHSSRLDWARDTNRSNGVVVLGWRVLRFS